MQMETVCNLLFSLQWNGGTLNGRAHQNGWPFESVVRAALRAADICIEANPRG